MMTRLKYGAIAGFAATLAVSLLEVINLWLGPWFVSFPRLLSIMLGASDNLAIGWIAHFVAGTALLGTAFGLLCPRLPTDTVESKGILFAVGAWVLMMFTVAPMAGLGIFAARADFPTMIWMFVSHVVFGVVLGAVYGRLVARSRHQQVPEGASVVR
ncbi:MAG: DUF6789 family protein [Brevundimonas sp.]|uniref:DUF6789 family protein n=1 Tax=Brevundimonas sp. TaxID=1871086 RepID=UPI00391930D0